ncbi:hypothetical protein ACKWTF_008551 [Chironomus riparius]
MVRRCCVDNCIESDLTILAHRFPKGEQIAIQWQNILNLNNIGLESLKQNYVVCTKHFSSKAYRNAISNSLNSTALPSLDVHKDNERIKSTRIKDKSKNVPLRCHKSPNSLKRQSSLVYTVQSIETSPAKRAKIDLEVLSIDPEVKLDEIEDPVALLDIEEKLEPIQIEESYIDYEIYDRSEVNEQIIPLPDQVSISVQTEASQIDQQIQTETAQIDKKVQTETTQSDQQVQTDKIEEPLKQASPAIDSKDDKLINLLYPEFNGKNKIELIKMIIERNQKVKSLEEEKQMLEEAMRKLL